MLEGLLYLHSLGIIHADIKLENILAYKTSEFKNKKFKISDFGLSQFVNEKGFAELKEYQGTKGYIAPEIKPGGCQITTKVDIWSLGVVLYEMCVAYKPTQVKQYKYGTGPIPFRNVDWKNRSPELIDLI